MLYFRFAIPAFFITLLSFENSSTQRTGS